MFQPSVTTMIAFVVIGMRCEIDSKFEILVIDKRNPKDIQIISF
jgi:hypothetical protein